MIVLSRLVLLLVIVRMFYCVTEVINMSSQVLHNILAFDFFFSFLNQ